MKTPFRQNLHLSFALVFFFIFTDKTNAQSPAIEWQRTIGGTSYDRFDVIVPTPDGGYIAGGSSTSGVGPYKSEICIGSYDYWVIKFDSTGNVQWENTIGGSKEDQLHVICNTPDNGYLIGGSSDSEISGDKDHSTIGPMGNPDIWILKLDNSGEIVWQRTIGSGQIDDIWSLEPTPEGGFIAGCAREQPGSFVYNYWMVKLSAVGEIEWDHEINALDDDVLSSLKQTIDGGYILAGSSKSPISGDKTEDNIEASDFWIIKTDSVGNILWQNVIGGDWFDYCTDIIEKPDGGFIIGGYSGSGIGYDKTDVTIGYYDIWIVKINSSGEVLWDKTYHANADDYLTSFIPFDGGYLLGGYSNSQIGYDKTENNMGAYNYDYWLIKTDESGNILWQNTIGGSGEDKLFSAADAGNNSLIIGGYSDSDISPDKSENEIDSSDYWILKLTSKFSTISGKAYIDINSNFILDADEISLSHHIITENTTGRYLFTDTNGSYAIQVTSIDSFQISADSIEYYQSIPALYDIPVYEMLQTDSLNDFPFQPSGEYDELSIDLFSLSSFRTGQTATYLVQYQNIGTTSLNIQITIYPDELLSYNSSDILPVLINPDSIQWNIGTLTPYQSGEFTIMFDVSTGADMGDVITTQIKIGSPGIIIYSDFLNSVVENFVIASFDPNNIIVNLEELTPDELASTDHLNYTINFQNTGNDTAFNIILNNTLPPDLDINTLHIIGSSHPLSSIDYYSDIRMLKFQFENILLPDSITNEPESHGYIVYSISPDYSLAIGDSISNQANIVFDYNDPVTTNFAVTKIICPEFIFYADFDSDGYGDADSIIQACEAPPEYVTNAIDCNDADNMINPEALELCNTVDDNCNGAVDEDLIFIIYYADTDLDGYGDMTQDSTACEIITGYVTDMTDCNDDDFFIFPGATEICNDLDDDCNTLTDDGLIFNLFYEDADGDNFGNATVFTNSCMFELTGYVLNATDCDDTNSLIFPGAEEICNNLDDDCNELTDDNLSYFITYLDFDSDNYGNAEIDTSSCIIPDGYVPDESDCDDTNAAINPDAPEISNGLDDNCNNIIDEGLSINKEFIPNIHIYPNPVKNEFKIETNLTGKILVQIFDASGKLILAKNEYTSIIYLDIRDISPGIYFIHLINDSQDGNLKFIKL